MTNTELQHIRQQLDANTPITHNEFAELEVLNKQYKDYIDQCRIQQDTKQAMYMRNHQMEILDLIKKAEKLMQK